MYLLTPQGIEANAWLAGEFLKIKLRECETLKEEIEHIRRDAKRLVRQ
jgi:hypothetical protein